MHTGDIEPKGIISDIDGVLDGGSAHTTSTSTYTCKCTPPPLPLVSVELHSFTLGLDTLFKEDFENHENVEELKLKLDIVAKSGHLINIIDIACPYDLYVESIYTKKIEKYECLKQLLSEKGYYCVIDAIVIGSLGAVHNKALSILLNMNMNKKKSKGLMKWCSTSNIIHAKKIWDIRCRLTFDQ